MRAIQDMERRERDRLVNPPFVFLGETAGKKLSLLPGDVCYVGPVPVKIVPTRGRRLKAWWYNVRCWIAQYVLRVDVNDNENW
jgi:hypothetical protein